MKSPPGRSVVSASTSTAGSASRAAIGRGAGGLRGWRCLRRLGGRSPGSAPGTSAAAPVTAAPFRKSRRSTEPFAIRASSRNVPRSVTRLSREGHGAGTTTARRAKPRNGFSRVLRVVVPSWFVTGRFPRGADFAFPASPWRPRRRSPRRRQTSGIRRRCRCVPPGIRRAPGPAADASRSQQVAAPVPRARMRVG